MMIIVASRGILKVSSMFTDKLRALIVDLDDASPMLTLT